MNKIKLTLVLLLGIISRNLSAQPLGNGMSKAHNQNIKNKSPDITYTDKSSTEKLDIYLPNEGSGSFPLIVSIHGSQFETPENITTVIDSLNKYLK